MARTTFLMGLMLLLSSSCSRNETSSQLQGTAEDLWGNTVELTAWNEGLTLIQPFSTSTCGYCLFDGEFAKRNYLYASLREEQRSYLQCLFNPQLDVYTYCKHYRCPDLPVLTFPPQLHSLHRNGFPHLIAVLDGDVARSASLYPYEKSFHEFLDAVEPERTPRLQLTSPLHLAAQLVLDNRDSAAVWVVPPGDEAGWERGRAFIARTAMGAVKYEDELAPEDLTRHLYFQGPLVDFTFAALSRTDIPVGFSGEQVRIGSYSLDRNEVGLKICFPNPHNRERFVVMYLHPPSGKLPGGHHYVDYAVYGAKETAVDDGKDDGRRAAEGAGRHDAGRGAPHGADAAQRELPVILEGHFAKSTDGRWEFDPLKAFAYSGIQDVCGPSGCPAPVERRRSVATHDRPVAVSGPRESPYGDLWTLGTAPARFPALTCNADGQCWVAWEEPGDILLASVGTADPVALAVEHDDSDSFRPVLASGRRGPWIAYLNDRAHYYRLVARSYDGRRLSPEVLLSETGPFDCVGPAAAGDGTGRLAFMWSEWKANYRYLKYRTIEDGQLEDAQSVAIAPTGSDYVNAWSPSLIFNGPDKLHGAWNQHYPAYMSVCSGDLAHEAAAVTRVAEDINECENGGYPSLCRDAAGQLRVFWESDGWDVNLGEPQRILTAVSRDGGAGWSLPVALSADEETFYNRTPRAAADAGGTVWVVWSGRDREGAAPWAIYLSHLGQDGAWCAPQRISDPDESARAPDIACSPDGGVWIAWHAGVGDAMTLRLMRYENGDLPG
ncbi:MAG: hypothetical protein GF355_16080 [Candidatus Eisenbacteria bacterium]|nr:hypothetical protein [Candidatus Eisenbacteria bacterium]